MGRKISYYVMQDETKQVFKSDSWNDCIDYLKTVKEEYEYDYMIRFNERDGTLIIQDVTTGRFLTGLNTIIVDESAGENPYSRKSLFTSIKERMEW